MSSATWSVPARYRSNNIHLQERGQSRGWRQGEFASDDASAVRELEFDPEEYAYNIDDDDPYPSLHPKPLIDSCTNEWRNDSTYSSPYSSPEREDDDLLHLFVAVLKGPKFRRYLMIYVLLFTLVVFGWKGVIKPRWREHQELVSALNEGLKLNRGGWFGTNSRPHFADMIQLKTLDKGLLPGSVKTRHHQSRLVIIGDVHGCKDELGKLLDKVSFDPRTDHLILTGDIIAKGPQSLDVIDLARHMGASCVRGNHEDRLLLVHRDLNSNFFPKKGPLESASSSGGEDTLDEESFSHGDYSDRALARKLSPEQVEWLQSCPVILRVGDIEGMGEVVVVHAGLVPGVDLEKQDPFGVMNMRTIDLETHVPSKEREGMEWYKLWNKHQSMLTKTISESVQSEIMKPPKHHTTVVYGHDSKLGLQLEKYTKGLDTGCVKGGKLTALVISDGGKQKIYQVNCKDHRPRRPVRVEVEDVLKDDKAGKE